MPRPKMVLEGGLKATDAVNLGALTQIFPRELLTEVLEETGRQSQRRRKLPGQVMMYYVMAMTLFMTVSCEEVLRLLLEGLRPLLPEGEKLNVATSSAISQARHRLGVDPLRQLYERTALPMATDQTKGAWYKGLRLVSIDGAVLDIADTPANEAAFGRPAASRGESAFPQVRLVSLMENGTHVLFGAQIAGCKVSEIALAREALTHLTPGMLNLADRNFFSFELFDHAAQTGADLLWRVKKNLILPRLKVLPDGSYLTRLHPDKNKRTLDGPGQLVRVVEYDVDIPGQPSRCRLVTTLLDPERYTAIELAILYHERWAIETAFAELKTYLRGRQTVLRSQSPDLVLQELYGLLLAHFALRGLMHEAALHGERDPGTLSFTHALNVVRRTLPAFAGLSPLKAA